MLKHGVVGRWKSQLETASTLPEVEAWARRACGKMEVTTGKSPDPTRGRSLGQKGLKIEGECALLSFKSEPFLHGV